MKKAMILGVAIALAACSQSPQEQAADNIQANAEMMADNLEAAADNATGATADALSNQADATRAMGDNMAEDLTTNDADTNLSNGM
jgi:outer membrane PBP1 activator LpoA protein